MKPLITGRDVLGKKKRFMNTTLARISIAQTNPTVGDIAANAENIIAAVNQARRLGSDLIVFPQLALSGAPLRDHLRKSSFFEALHSGLKYKEEIVLW